MPDPAPPLKTWLDWSAHADAGLGDAYADIPRHGGDFAKAVAVCINSRRCETETKGVMCPSFRASGNPNLSTGGRVRLLKAALNSDLTGPALADPGLAEAMDLCVACKGCKRECENNVDMALIKTEYLAQRYGGRGPGLRGRLFAHLPLWQHRYPWFDALVRRRNRWPWLARLTQSWLGIAAALPLPERVPVPAGDQAPVQVAGTATTRSDTGGRSGVLLLVDTFTRYYEPGIAAAAQKVLEAAGYQVRLAVPLAADAEPGRPLCCGRTYLAQGMVDEARAEARRLLTALLPQVRAGWVLVGLEPSCLLGLRDDYRALGLGDEVLELGRAALLFEEFLAREAQAGRLRLDFRAGAGEEAGPTLVHGHCHQKAAGAMKSMRKVLKLVPGLGFDFIEAGCCGMAGAFGLECEHADLAGAMAGQALLPALAAQPGAMVIANGFACRQQIRAHTARDPRHLAVVLSAALDA